MLNLVTPKTAAPQTEAEKLFLQLQNDPAAIYYEDDYLLIVNKPAGLLVHPSVKEEGSTIFDFVSWYYRQNKLTCTLHPVARLDRYTSGLVIFAKAPRIQFLLTQKNITKEYLALVTGKLPRSQGLIDAPIARKEGSIIERCISKEGKPAQTAFQVLAEYPRLSLVKLQLLTGRTHQLRVHLASLGCPIYNDHLYGPPGPQSRHALHATRLAFTHPVTQTYLEISCDLPGDLQKLLR